MEHNGKDIFSAPPAVSPYITQKQFRRNQSVQRPGRCAYFPFPKGNRSVCGEKFPAIFASLFRFPQAGNLVFGRIGKEMKLLFRFKCSSNGIVVVHVAGKGRRRRKDKFMLPQNCQPKVSLEICMPPPPPLSLFPLSS